MKNQNQTETFADAYKLALDNVLNNAEFICNTRGQKVKEILNYKLHITNPLASLWTNKARDLPLKYLKNELKLYYTANNNLEDFTKASKFWDKIQDNKDGYNDNKKVNSAYGYLIFQRTYFNKYLEQTESQFDWALNKLIDDKDSRQAVLFLGNPTFQYPDVNDFVCTLSYHFFIRNDKLHMIVNRRSQDIFFGMTFDVPWELSLMQLMCNSLRDTYKNIELGSYHLNCNSLHCYERNIDILEKMNNEDFFAYGFPEVDIDYCLLTDSVLNKNIEDVNIDSEFINWLKESEK